MIQFFPPYNVEIQSPVGRVEGEPMNMAQAALKPQQVLSSEQSPMGTTLGPVVEEVQAKKSLLKWKGNKKINQIYADWLDDFPLFQNTPGKPES